MGYYQNNHPIAWPDERFVPVPGWGMRPELAGPRTIAMGLDLPVQTPVGTYNVSVPVEDAARAVAEATWPILQKSLEAEAPKLGKLAVDAAWPSLQQKLEAEAPKALTRVGPQLEETINRSLRGVYALGVVMVAAVAASAWWVKKR